MLDAIANIFRVADLRKKILVTLSLLIVYRVGCFIPTPGVDTVALGQFFARLAENQGQTLLGIMNLFTGGALTRLSIFALGIMPYISSSIIMQLLTAIIPSLEKMAKEGKAGYEKINQYTRYLTFILCGLQGYMLAIWLGNPGNFNGSIIVPHAGPLFKFTTVLTLGCGTIFIMWLGEQIQERGIGNGISLIITVSIISRIPHSVGQLYNLYVVQKTLPGYILFALLVLWFLVIMAVVLFTQAQRRIPVQYGKRVIGRKVYGGRSQYLPIRVDMAGVIAIIFAQSVILFPATIAAFLPQNSKFAAFIQTYVHEQGLWYNIVYMAFIMFFMYFYTAIVFNPLEISNNLKKYGGFIPGIRPGKPTADYLDFVATRIVFVGSAYICVIAVLPTLIMALFRVPYDAMASFFGGTTLLILVGVVLDTMKQLEGQLLVRHYEGFMRKGTLKGRR